MATYAPIVPAFYTRVKHLPGVSLSFVNNYLYVLISRNIVSGGSPLIHSRMSNSYGQPIYVLHTGDTADLCNACLVDTLEEAKAICPELTDTQLPQPLQWSDDISDYYWDPSVTYVYTSPFALDHIIHDNIDRLPDSIAKVPVVALQRLIREALRDGVARANADCAYALPFYSRRGDCVSMLLPFRVLTDDSTAPEAVLVLHKSKEGYRLATILTTAQAYNCVRAFRDPEQTWLKGAYKEDV